MQERVDAYATPQKVGRVDVDGTGATFVVLVPFAIPGEVVSVRVRKALQGHAVGELVEVLEASAARVAPACALFGSCGGCQLQHMALEAQRDWKRRHVEDALGRIAMLGQVEVQSVVGGDRAYGYRSKLTPHFETRAPVPRKYGGAPKAIDDVRGTRRARSILSRSNEAQVSFVS